MPKSHYGLFAVIPPWGADSDFESMTARADDLEDLAFDLRQQLIDLAKAARNLIHEYGLLSDPDDPACAVRQLNEQLKSVPEDITCPPLPLPMDPPNS